MSSFAAYLEVSGNRYSLHRYELSIYQETDALGRPSSPVLGGKIDCTLTITASHDSFLDQWMLSPTLQKDGLIRLLDPLTASTFKIINFFNAYCTGMDLHFLPGQTGGAGSTLLQVQISPQRIAVGAIVHDNNWPLESHGAGESHEKQTFVPTSEDVHTALDAAGDVPLPLVGTVTGIADTALYLAEGDLGGAALAAGGALLGVLPFGRLAGKGIVKGVKWAAKTTWGRRLLKNATELAALSKRTKARPKKMPSIELIPLTKSQFGHTFTTHGQNQTEFLINRARGSGKSQGQFLDDQAAAQLIMENQGKLGQGAVSVPIPKGFPARIINPDGTFSQATHIRLVPSGKGVKTAYPEIIP